MSLIQSFPPVICERSRVLILGSMPGEASLRAGQYYAHPHNAFWRIMGALFAASPSLPYQDRLLRLRSAGVALWDSLHRCVRPGSLDAAITQEVANDFPNLLANYPGIAHVFFNGGKAESVFRRHVLPAINAPCRFTRLPSTSPAYAAMPFEAKLQAWSIVRQTLDQGLV